MMKFDKMQQFSVLPKIILPNGLMNHKGKGLLCKMQSFFLNNWQNSQALACLSILHVSVNRMLLYSFSQVLIMF